MSDAEGDGGGGEEEKKFFAELAKTGRANCKKCKMRLEAGKLRLAKAGYNPFGPGLLKQWHHVPCLFDVFSRQRKTTPKIESPDDIDGWSDLDDEDKDEILKFLPGCSRDTTPKKKNDPSDVTPAPAKTESKAKKHQVSQSSSQESQKDASSRNHKDNSFREFRKLCMDVENISSYTAKTAVVEKMFTKGTDGGCISTAVTNFQER